MKKVQNIGSCITFTLDKCKGGYKNVHEIHPNHLQTLVLYGNFMKYILNDIEDAKKLLDKADYIEESTNLNRQFMEDKRLKYNENANFGSVIVSGNHNSLGDIRAVNYQIIQITGYSKDEMKGQNVEMIIPPILRPFHNFFMKRYLSDKKAKVMNVERSVAASDKNNFLIPCSLLIKPIPTLQSGIEIIGLLTPNKDLFTEYSDSL